MRDSDNIEECVCVFVCVFAVQVLSYKLTALMLPWRALYCYRYFIIFLEKKRKQNNCNCIRCMLHCVTNRPNQHKNKKIKLFHAVSITLSLVFKPDLLALH